MTAPPAGARSRDFPGTVEAAVDAEAWIMSQSRDLGLAEDATFAVNLCLEELFLNAVRHGRAKSASVSLWREADGVRVEFVDDGQAFDPTAAPAKRISGPNENFDIGGFGAGLVRKFSKRMTYRRADGRNRLLARIQRRTGRGGGPGVARRAMIPTPELRAAVRAASCFRDLSEAEITLLIEAGKEQAFEPLAILMTQGEPSDSAMLILSGEVTVTADSARGPIPVSSITAPALVGEMGALAQLPRTATVRARTPVAALRIGRAALLEVARAAPSLLIDVIGRMGDRLRRFNSAIGLYTHALAALQRHDFDAALLEELRHPIPDLADFGHTFGRMADEMILRRQRDDEMASAAVIQRALLPKVEEFRAESGLDVCASMTPARDVGGDFFDLVRLADGRVAVGVGDVCGKGVPAALFMGITRTLIRINLRETPDLPGAILKANAYLANNNAGQLFATLLYAAFDPASGEVEYCSCGHLPALIRRAGGGVEAFDAGGLPVGLFDDMRMRTRRTALATRRSPFLYTDGVTEAEDGEAAQFGEDRLHDLLAGDLAGRSSAWIHRIEDAVRAFSRGAPQFDDITCLALLR